MSMRSLTLLSLGLEIKVQRLLVICRVIFPFLGRYVPIHVETQYILGHGGQSCCPAIPTETFDSKVKVKTLSYLRVCIIRYIRYVSYVWYVCYRTISYIWYDTIPYHTYGTIRYIPYHTYHMYLT